MYTVIYRLYLIYAYILKYTLLYMKTKELNKQDDDNEEMTSQEYHQEEYEADCL